MNPGICIRARCYGATRRSGKIDTFRVWLDIGCAPGTTRGIHRSQDEENTGSATTSHTTSAYSGRVSQGFEPLAAATLNPSVTTLTQPHHGRLHYIQDEAVNASTAHHIANKVVLKPQWTCWLVQCPCTKWIRDITLISEWVLLWDALMFYEMDHTLILFVVYFMFWFDTNLSKSPNMLTYREALDAGAGYYYSKDLLLGKLSPKHGRSTWMRTIPWVKQGMDSI